jgi:hypothetical protein
LTDIERNKSLNTRGIEFLTIGALFALMFSPSEVVRAQPVPPACELHVFSEFGVGVFDATQIKIEQGVIGNQIRDGVLNMFRIKDPAAVQAFLAEALPPADQLAMIKSVDYANTLRGKGRTVVIHDQPTHDVTLNNYKKQPKLVAGSTACYSEMIISGTYFERSTLSKKLKTSYYLRDFSQGTTPVRATFKAAGTAVSNFPPKDAADAKAARESVRRIAQQHVLTIANTK